MADSKSGGGDPFIKSDIIWFLIIIFILFGAWVVRDGNNKTSSPKSIFPSLSDKERPSEKPNNSTEDEPDISKIKNSATSVYKGQIKIRLGNVSEIQPNRQYIYLNANGSNKSPVNISNWILRNNRGEKVYRTYGNTIKGVTSEARIPATGVISFNPYKPGSNYAGSIIMNPGDEAIVVTGRVPNTSPVAINTSFKVNRCFQYIANLDGYKFFPSLNVSCPDEKSEINMKQLDSDCYRYINGMSRCREPKITVNGCVDKNCNLLPYCQTLIRTFFNFQSCYDLHSDDSDFITKQWRIFLNYPGSLWDASRATIYLYDDKGKLVDSYSYN